MPSIKHVVDLQQAGENPGPIRATWSQHIVERGIGDVACYVSGGHFDPRLGISLLSGFLLTDTPKVLERGGFSLRNPSQYAVNLEVVADVAVKMYLRRSLLPAVHLRRKNSTDASPPCRPCVVVRGD